MSLVGRSGGAKTAVQIWLLYLQSSFLVSQSPRMQELGTGEQGGHFVRPHCAAITPLYLAFLIGDFSPTKPHQPRSATTPLFFSHYPIWHSALTALPDSLQEGHKS